MNKIKQLREQLLETKNRLNKRGVVCNKNDLGSIKEFEREYQKTIEEVFDANYSGDVINEYDISDALESGLSDEEVINEIVDSVDDEYLEGGISDLPIEVTISKSDLRDLDDIEESISDYLSDTYGFCHFGFDFDDLGDEVFVYEIEWDTKDDDCEYDDLYDEDEHARIKQLKDLYDSEPSDLTSKELEELKASGILDENFLIEGASNFPTFEGLPLLVFLDYEDELEKLYYDAKQEYNELGDDSLDFYEFEDEYIEKHWGESHDAIILDGDAQENLKDDLDALKDKLYDLSYEYIDQYGNEDEDSDGYSLQDFADELKIESGYYEGYYIDLDERAFKYLSDEHKQLVLDELDTIKSKYDLTELELAYRASNGETGFNIKEGREGKHIADVHLTPRGAKVKWTPSKEPVEWEVVWHSAKEDDTMFKSFDTREQAEAFIDVLKTNADVVKGTIDGPNPWWKDEDGELINYKPDEEDDDMFESKKKLKEGFIGQTLGDFLDDCNNKEDITLNVFDVGGEGNLVFEGSYDEIPSELLDAKFNDFECYGDDIFQLIVNVSEDGESMGGYYETIDDFLGDCNDFDEVHVFDIDKEEEVFVGEKYDIPSEVSSLVFNSFESPSLLTINVEVDSEELDESKRNETFIYLFPELKEKDIEELKKYNLKYLGKNKFEDEENWVVKGLKKDLSKFSKEYLDYIMHPDYLYKEDEFGGEIIEEGYDDLDIDYDMAMANLMNSADYSLKKSNENGKFILVDTELSNEQEEKSISSSKEFIDKHEAAILEYIEGVVQDIKKEDLPENGIKTSKEFISWYTPKMQEKYDSYIEFKALRDICAMIENPTKVNLENVEKILNEQQLTEKKMNKIDKALNFIVFKGKKYPIRDKDYLNNKLASMNNEFGLEDIATIKTKKDETYKIYDSGFGNIGSSYACAVKIDESLTEANMNKRDKALKKALTQLKKPGVFAVIIGYTQGKEKVILEKPLVKKSQEELQKFADSFRRGKEQVKVTVDAVYPRQIDDIKNYLQGAIKEELNDSTTNENIIKELNNLLEVVNFELTNSNDKLLLKDNGGSNRDVELDVELPISEILEYLPLDALVDEAESKEKLNIENAIKLINNSNLKIKDILTLTEKKSRKKDYILHVNKNAGDPAKNIAHFNHMMGSDSGVVASESLKEEKEIEDWTEDKLWELRNQITLGSYFIKDYKNSMGVDAKICSNFFEGYMSYLEELAEEEDVEDIMSLDNKENLSIWHDMFQDEPLVVSKEIEEELSKDILSMELEDDETSTGGVSFKGETVKDFIEETKSNFKNINELNKTLNDCGIKSIKVK